MLSRRPRSIGRPRTGTHSRNTASFSPRDCERATHHHRVACVTGTRCPVDMHSSLTRSQTALMKGVQCLACRERIASQIRISCPPAISHAAAQPSPEQLAPLSLRRAGPRKPGESHRIFIAGTRPWLATAMFVRERSASRFQFAAQVGHRAAGSAMPERFGLCCFPESAPSRWQGPGSNSRPRPAA